MKKIFGAFPVRWRAKDGENAFALVPSLTSTNIPLGADGYVADDAAEFSVDVAMVIGSARVTRFTTLAVTNILGGSYGFYPPACTASTGLVEFFLSYDDNVVEHGVLNNIFRVTGTCQYNGATYTASCDISVCFTQNGKDADPVIELKLSNPLVTIPLDSNGNVAGNVSEERRVTMYKGSTAVAIASLTCADRGTFGPTGDGVWNYAVGNAANADLSRTITVTASSGTAGGGMTTDTLTITATATIDGKSVTRMAQLEIVATAAGQSTTGPQGDAYTIDGPDIITYNSKTGSVMPERATWTARNNGTAVNTTLRAIYNGSQVSTFTSGSEYGIADFLDQEAPGLKSGGTFTLQMLVNNATVAAKTVVVEAVRYVIYRGPTAWEEGRVYYGGEWDAEAENFIIDIVTQKDSGTTYFFYCRQKNRKKTSSQTAESYDINVTPYADTQNNPIGTYWKRAQKIPFVATELLLADGAVIDWLQGRTMTLTDANSNVVGGLTGDLDDNINTQLWLGASYTNRGNAPFRVTSAGALYAENATISGEFTVGSAQQGITINASGWMQFKGQYTVGARTYNNVLTIAPDPYNGGKLTGVGLVTDTSHNVSASAKLYLAPSCIETIRIGTTHSVMGIGGVYEGLFLAAADFNSDMSLPQGYTDYNLMTNAYSQYYKEMIHITPAAIQLNSSVSVVVNGSFYSNPGITLSAIGFNADQAIADGLSGGTAINSGYIKILNTAGSGYIYLCFYGGILRGFSMEQPTGAPYGYCLN